MLSSPQVSDSLGCWEINDRKLLVVVVVVVVVVGMKASDAFFCSERIIKVPVAGRRWDQWKPLAVSARQEEAGRSPWGRREGGGGGGREICILFGFCYLGPSGWSFGCWCVGVLVCWCVGVLVCWCVGVLVCWLVCWSVGLLVCWCAGVLVCWCVGVLVCWCVGVLVCWCVGVLVCWCVGVLVCWCVGVLMCWCVGVLVCWCVGVLVCWCVSVLVCWCVDVLMCWCVGVLVCWCVGVLVCWCVSPCVCDGGGRVQQMIDVFHTRCDSGHGSRHANGAQTLQGAEAQTQTPPSSSATCVLKFTSSFWLEWFLTAAYSTWQHWNPA